MEYTFPEGFLWGTSTAATCIETASAHNWQGVTSRDGEILERTADHETRREEDVEHITRFGSVYRCSVDWARLQPAPFIPFDTWVVQEYRDFFRALRRKGMRIMLVLHHYTHPGWLEEKKGWTNENAITHFVDFTQRCSKAFGDLISYWQTFHKPGEFARQAYVAGRFPPLLHSKVRTAKRVLRFMGQAHCIAYDLLKEAHPSAPIGITVSTLGTKDNTPGRISSDLLLQRTYRRLIRHFEQVDFWALSQYPCLSSGGGDKSWLNRFFGSPTTQQNHAAYQPEGLHRHLLTYWKQFKKPIFITEQGICIPDTDQRIALLQAYLQACHRAIESGVDLQGYLHSSTFDGFAWSEGPSHRCGLVAVDPVTGERNNTAVADFYENVCKQNGF